MYATSRHPYNPPIFENTAMFKHINYRSWIFSEDHILLTLSSSQSYTVERWLNKSVFQSLWPSSVSRICRTSGGGFNPIFSALLYRSILVMPTHGPYLGERSKFLRMVCMVFCLSGWTIKGISMDVENGKGKERYRMGLFDLIQWTSLMRLE